MSDADRIVRARERQHREEEERASRARTVELAKMRSTAYANIASLIPQVLNALRKHGFPDATLVEVPTLFGRRRKAAWKVTEVAGLASENDPDPVVPYWLLSDGSLLLHGFNGNKPASAEKWPVDPRTLEGGLECLLKKYQ